jgi:hypothetical protein
MALMPKIATGVGSVKSSGLDRGNGPRKVNARSVVMSEQPHRTGARRQQLERLYFR